MGSCNNTIEINTPIQKVWETICDFHDLSWAPEVISSLSVVGDKKGGEVGAKRLLNDAFHETLTSVDESAYTFSYSIDDGPGPVAKDAVDNYVGVVSLTEIDNGTQVSWTSTFESGNDDEVADFCNPIYSALLSALKGTLS